jgi:hypothetical protein
MPLNLFLKIALFITITILGPGDIAPRRHTINILRNNIIVIVYNVIDE